MAARWGWATRDAKGCLRARRRVAPAKLKGAKRRNGGVSHGVGGRQKSDKTMERNLNYAPQNGDRMQSDAYPAAKATSPWRGSTNLRRSAKWTFDLPPRLCIPYSSLSRPRGRCRRFGANQAPHYRMLIEHTPRATPPPIFPFYPTHFLELRIRSHSTASGFLRPRIFKCRSSSNGIVV